MTKKYGPKKDANHNIIVDVFNKMGVPFLDLSKAGFGIPDGVAGVKGQWRLVEIKNPKTGYGRRGLNPIQTKWLAQLGQGEIYVLRTVEEAICFCKGEFSECEIITSEQCAKKVIEEEIKSAQKETDALKAAKSDHGLTIHVVKSVDEALAVLGAK